MALNKWKEDGKSLEFRSLCQVMRKESIFVFGRRMPAAAACVFQLHQQVVSVSEGQIYLFSFSWMKKSIDERKINVSFKMELKLLKYMIERLSPI